MKINNSEFEQWWNASVGLEFRKMLKEDMDKLSYGTMTESYARDQIANAIEVGKFQAIQDIYNMNYKFLMGEE